MMVILTALVQFQETLSQLFLQDFENKHGFGINDLKSKNPILFLLFTLDFWLCHIVIGPSVAAFWRGVWNSDIIWLQDGLCGGDITLANMIAIVIGLCITSVIGLFHQDIKKKAGEVGSLQHTISRHCFSLIWGWGYITLWKGVWDGYNFWVGKGIPQSLSSLLIGLVSLTFSRTLRSAQALPIGVSVDKKASQISYSSFLGTDKTSTTLKRLLDVVLSRLVELSVILCWHGIWTIMDIVTEDVEMMNMTRLQSAWGSLIVGWSLGLFLFFFQFPLLVTHQYCKNTITKGFYYIFFQAYIILGVIATIASFRASWYLLDSYFITCDVVTSQIVGMVLGITILCSLKTISSLHSGVSFDSPRNGIVIGFHLTSFWYIEKTSKKSETTISQIKEVPVQEIKQSDEVHLPMRKNSFLRHII